MKMFLALIVTIGKEMKSTSTKKKFRRVIHVSENISSFCD